MSVVSQVTSISYAADGTNRTFGFPYYFINQDDLLVQQTTPAGTVINNTLNTDYLISGTPNIQGDYPSGANVVFNLSAVPAGGNTVFIGRHTDKTQLINYIDNSPFTADSLNHALDKLTLEIQEILTNFGGIAIGPPSGSYPVGTWWINANPIAGGPFGWVVCTDGYAHPFGLISL
jgi:hypothetical protein